MSRLWDMGYAPKAHDHNRSLRYATIKLSLRSR